MSTPLAEAPGWSLLQTFRTAVADDLALFARLHGGEMTAETANALRAREFPLSLALTMEAGEARSVQTMLYEETRCWPADFPESLRDELAADYAGIYLNNYCNASPQESYWLDEDHLAWQTPMFEVRKVYARHGLEVANWRIQADDHLSPQLHFLAWLLEQDDDQSHLADVADFLDEHLLLWLGDFSSRVARRCSTPFYAGVAILTNHYCETLRDVLAEMLEKPRGDRDEIIARRKRENSEPVAVKFIPGAQPSW